MFDFKVVVKEGTSDTHCILKDFGVVVFSSNERRTSVRASIPIGDGLERLSVCRHVHNEKKVGAASNPFNGIRCRLDYLEDAKVKRNPTQEAALQKRQEDMAYYFKQSYSFRTGFQDCRGGCHFDNRMNEEWQRGWRFANERLTR